MEQITKKPGSAGKMGLDLNAPHGYCSSCASLRNQLLQLQNQSAVRSEEFSEAIGQLGRNRKAKVRAENLDERLLEQYIRAKTDAESELQTKTKIYTATLEKIKSASQVKTNGLSKTVNKLRHELSEQNSRCEEKISQIAENSRLDAQRYETIITRLKTQTAEHVNTAKVEADRMVSEVKASTAARYSHLPAAIAKLEQQNRQLITQFEQLKINSDELLRKKEHTYQKHLSDIKAEYEQKTTFLNSQVHQRLKSQADELAKTKCELNEVAGQVGSVSKSRVRAEELNQRLLDQCQMAKTGADVEIDLRTKEFTEQLNQLKSHAAQKLKSISGQNTSLKGQARKAITQIKQKAEQQQSLYTQALNQANARIKALEQLVVKQRSGVHIGV